MRSLIQAISRKTPPCGRAPACLDLAIDAAGDVIAGQQFGRPAGVLVALRVAPSFLFGVGGLLFVEIGNFVEHEPAAFAVAQNAAFAAHAFGHQDAAHADRPDHAGRMELDELHVLQFGAGAIGQRKAIAGVFPAVAGDLEGAPDSAGGQHHGLRLPQMEVALLAVVSAGAGDAARVHQQAEHGALHVDLHAAVNAVILQGADHLQAGAIADVGQARISMAAEVSLQNPAVLGAVEERAPGFEFAHALRRFLGVQLRHAPVVEVLAAAHGIGEMHAPVVAIVDVRQRGGNAALGHHGVRFAQQRFADHAHFGAGSRGFDRGAQTRPARADHQDVVGEPLELRHLQDSPVVPDAHRAEADVDIGESHPEQTRPRPLLVSRVQAAHAVVELVPDGVFRDAGRRFLRPGAGRRGSRRRIRREGPHSPPGRGSDPDPEAVGETEGHRSRRKPESPTPGRRAAESSDGNSAGSAESFVRRDKSCAARPPRMPEDRPRTTCSKRRGSSSRSAGRGPVSRE